MDTPSVRLRIVIAPDKFKGSLTAAQAAHAIAAGWSTARPGDEIRIAPMADGGDGTAAVIADATTPQHWVSVEAHDAIGRIRAVRYPILPDGTAVIELAAVCGIAALKEPSPMRAHTFGLGVVIRDAITRNSRRIVVGLGGSASTDGGAGALMALGARMLDASGTALKPGGDLRNIDTIDLSRIPEAPPKGIDVFVDTSAVLTGPDGAARVFARQKGANDQQITELDAGLSRLAAVLGDDPRQPGSGAAGGTAYGLQAALKARLVPGAASVANLISLPALLESADLVITGEGRYDASSDLGKVTGFVRNLAVETSTAALVVAGDIADGRSGLSMVQVTGSRAESEAHPREWLTETVRRFASDASAVMVLAKPMRGHLQ